MNLYHKLCMVDEIDCAVMKLFSLVHYEGQSYKECPQNFIEVC